MHIHADVVPFVDHELDHPESPIEIEGTFEVGPEGTAECDGSRLDIGSTAACTVASMPATCRACVRL